MENIEKKKVILAKYSMQVLLNKAVDESKV